MNHGVWWTGHINQPDHKYHLSIPITMADYERTILEHYQLTTAYPIEWPAEKDNSDASDEEDNGGKAARNGMMRRSKSRYSALERAASDRKSLLPGAQRGENGVENMVSRDEPDPLGSSDSVVRILRARGLPVQDDPRIRNRFLLSSTTFSPTLFLSQVHQDASTQDLLSGLEKLSESIDQKSASLKQLVELNFERFVRAKATIDNVYTEMKYRGAEPTPPPRTIRTHSRHASRTSFRASSGNQASMANSEQDSRKKNALTKESEYGVMGIKKPLLELSAKAEEVWGPALGGRDKEESMKVMTEMAERYKEMHEVGTIMTEKIKQRDYEGIAEEYRRAASFADDARKIVERLDMKPNDAEITQILLAGRVWNDVERQIRSFKEEIWQKLGSTQNVAIRSDSLSPQDQHMELINILLELGVEKNPVWIWLETRYDYLKNKIQITSDRSRMAIEVSRRRLASGGEPTAQVIASHLRSLGRQTVEDKPTSMDSSDIIELWEQSLAFTREMLSAQGILGEVTDFWQTVQSFLKGDLQKKLSIGINGQSKRHHELSKQEVTQLREAAVELVDMLRESVSDFFSKLPPEDISPLFSPLPPNTPTTPMSRSYGSQLTPGFRDRQFDDPKNMPPPSPKTGQSWEKLAFWPPWSNSLSGVHYLAKLLSLVGTGASEMASISPVNGDSKAMKMLQDLTTEAREKCVIAICAAWNKDAENIKVLEDWRRSPEKRDLTRMPAYFEAFESAILTGMQKIVYISEAKLNTYEVVAPPPSKLLQMVRSQFVTTLYKSLSGMVENAEKSIKKLDDDWAMDTDGLASPVAMVVATSIGAGTVNAGDKVSRSSAVLTQFLTDIERSNVIDTLQPECSPRRCSP